MAGCLAALTACSASDGIPEPADGAIRFDNRNGQAYIDRPARGVQTDDNTLAEFGVFAYYSPTGGYDAAASRPDYMYDVRVTRPEGVWTYTPLKYWPAEGVVSFFAYTPCDTGADISVECTTGAPVVTYAVADDVAAHRDLMLSAPALDRTKDGGKVPLVFRHALACVAFEACVNASLAADAAFRVKEIHLGNFSHKAACHHESPEAIAQTFTLDAADKGYRLSVAGATLLNADLTQEYQPITSPTGNVMLWPQTVDETDKLTVTAEYITDGTTKAMTVEKNLSDLIPQLAPGKRYLLKLRFNPFGDLSLTCTVQEWNKETIDVPQFD